MVLARLSAGLGSSLLSVLPAHAHTPFDQMLTDLTTQSLTQIVSGLFALDPSQTTQGFAALTSGWAALLTDYPLGIFVLVLIAGILAVFGGAICRSTACEFSQQIVHPWQTQLTFALQRWKTLLGAALLPGIFLAGIALVLLIAGMIFFGSLPGLDLLGSLFFGLATLLALAGAVVCLLWVFAGPLLIPAAACEGTDAIDAAQRAFAYAIAKPLRLMVYLFVAGGVCAFAIAIATGLIQGGLAFASHTLGFWAGPTGQAQLARALGTTLSATDPSTPITPTPTTTLPELHGLAAAAGSIIGFWSSVLTIVLWAYATSLFFSASTLIYLFMRQLVDGQHHAELWTPGQIDIPKASTPASA